MTRQILKPILLGIAIGAVLYTIPFFPGFLVFLLLFGLTRFFWGWGYRRRWNYSWGIHLVFTDAIRNMSNEEYEAFKRRYDCYPGSDAPKSETKQSDKL